MLGLDLLLLLELELLLSQLLVFLRVGEVELEVSVVLKILE